MAVFHSFAQVREDLARYVDGLETDLVWRRMPGGSLGFHLKHLAGSADRLTSYLLKEALNARQLEYLSTEAEGSESSAALLESIARSLSSSESKLLTIDDANPFEARLVGRHQLATTKLGLLVHLAEHTQRHLGQCITLSHLLRQSG